MRKNKIKNEKENYWRIIRVENILIVKMMLEIF